VGKSDIKITVDASGLSCPMPIVRTAQAVKTASSGDLIEVIATDPGSVKDFEAWAKATGSVLVEQTVVDGKYHFVLRLK
jgi:tRNA 2-thiouridine synthesizing protein A